jgi:hypothetical protein
MIYYLKRTDTLTPFIFLHPKYKTKRFVRIDSVVYLSSYHTLDNQFDLNDVLAFSNEFKRKKYDRHDSTLEGFGMVTTLSGRIVVLVCYPCGVSLQSGLEGYKQLTFILEDTYFSSSSELTRFEKMLANYGLSKDQIMIKPESYIRENFVTTDILIPSMKDYDLNVQSAISKEFLQNKVIEYTKWNAEQGKYIDAGDWVIVTDAIRQSTYASRLESHPELIGYMFRVRDIDNGAAIFYFNKDNSSTSVIAPDNRYRINYNKSFLRHATDEEIENWLKLHPEDAIMPEPVVDDEDEDDIMTEPEVEEEESEEDYF